jgi:hypothetical protein
VAVIFGPSSLVKRFVDHLQMIDSMETCCNMVLCWAPPAALQRENLICAVFASTTSHLAAAGWKIKIWVIFGQVKRLFEIFDNSCAAWYIYSDRPGSGDRLQAYTILSRSTFRFLSS